MSKRKLNNKVPASFKIHRAANAKRRDADIDYNARISAAKGLSQYFKAERVRIENLCPWYLKPLMYIVRRYLYAFYFLQIDNVTVQDWETGDVVKRYFRYVPNGKERLEAARQLEEEKAKKTPGHNCRHRQNK